MHTIILKVDCSSCMVLINGEILIKIGLVWLASLDYW